MLPRKSELQSTHSMSFHTLRTLQISIFVEDFFEKRYHLFQKRKSYPFLRKRLPSIRSSHFSLRSEYLRGTKSLSLQGSSRIHSQRIFSLIARSYPHFSHEDQGSIWVLVQECLLWWSQSKIQICSSLEKWGRVSRRRIEWNKQAKSSDFHELSPTRFQLVRLCDRRVVISSIRPSSVLSHFLSRGERRQNQSTKKRWKIVVIWRSDLPKQQFRDSNSDSQDHTWSSHLLSLSRSICHIWVMVWSSISWRCMPETPTSIHEGSRSLRLRAVTLMEARLFQDPKRSWGMGRSCSILVVLHYLLWIRVVVLQGPMIFASLSVTVLRCKSTIIILLRSSEVILLLLDVDDQDHGQCCV